MQEQDQVKSPLLSVHHFFFLLHIPLFCLFSLRECMHKHKHLLLQRRHRNNDVDFNDICCLIVFFLCLCLSLYLYLSAIVSLWTHTRTAGSSSNHNNNQQKCFSTNTISVILYYVVEHTIYTHIVRYEIIYSIRSTEKINHKIT